MANTDNHEQYQLAMDSINDPGSNVTDMFRHVLALAINTDKETIKTRKSIDEVGEKMVVFDGRLKKTESKDSRAVAWIGVFGAGVGGGAVALINLISNSQ